MPVDMNLTDSEVIAELQAIAAESLGWQPLTDGAYLHHVDQNNSSDDAVVYVVGIPDLAFAGLNVLLLT